MKILLIRPKVESDWIRKYKFDYTYAPYGLQLIAAVTPEKHEVKIVDENVHQVIDFNEPVDLVGITGVTAQAPRAYEIASIYKKKGTKVVIGGFHASLMTEEALQYCDTVCIGEGELIWGQVLEDAEKGELKRTYRADQLADLNTLSLPRRELSQQKYYKLYSILQTSRGCPFQCSFCTVTKFFGNKYRFRPVESIVEEIRQLKEKKQLEYNFVYFLDDNIVGNKKYAKELFKALIPLKINWWSQCSVHIADDEELLTLAYKSGCKQLCIGFESVSDSTLRDLNKKFGTAEVYAEAIKKIQAHKITIFGLFIVGFDSDTKDVFENTIKFVEDNHIEYVGISVLTPLPGTIFYDQYKAEGRLLHEVWSYYDTVHTVYQPKNMTAEELQDLYIKAWKRLYSFKSIFKRVRKTKGGFFGNFIGNLYVKMTVKHLPTKVFYPKEAEKAGINMTKSNIV